MWGLKNVIYINWASSWCLLLWLTQKKTTNICKKCFWKLKRENHFIAKTNYNLKVHYVEFTGTPKCPSLILKYILDQTMAVKYFSYTNIYTHLLLRRMLNNKKDLSFLWFERVSQHQQILIPLLPSSLSFFYFFLLIFLLVLLAVFTLPLIKITQTAESALLTLVRSGLL